MEHAFWHEKWDKNDIAFHEGEVNTLLARNVDRVFLDSSARIFLPLCGKTRDIAWLRARGHPVAGAELSERAVADLFSEMGLEPKIEELGGLRAYRAPGLDIFAGDIFALDAGMLGPVDGVYDRAALVALPDEMRRQYAEYLPDLTGSAPTLLITFDYDQSALKPPPFSVPEAAVRALHGQSYRIDKLDEEWVPGKLKRQVEALEQVWHLQALR